MQYQTFSEKETKKLGAKLAREIKSGVIALTGQLGTGKTTFVQGFAEGLRIKEKIISPTFILIRQHKIPKSNNVFFHVDLYRLEDEKNLRQLGIEDLWADTNNIVLIEWAEKAKRLLPKETTWIKFEQINENKRRITIH